MIRRFFLFAGILTIFLLLTGCGAKRANIIINSGSVAPGSMISKGDKKMSLLGKPLEIDATLPDTELVDAKTLVTVNLKDRYRNKVMLLSIVPSLDTKVCEAQTHYLGEKGDRMPPDIVRITISRDTPFAQSRFAKEAKLTDIDYFSDYKRGDFGRSTGLLIDGSLLLARSVLVVDRQGIVRYIQVVPEISNLPNMEKAFDKAIALYGHQ